MGKALKKLPAIQKEQRIIKITALVYAALDNGYTTRAKLVEATGLKAWEITELLKNDIKLNAVYTIRRRELVNMAADNIVDIVSDKDHPNNYAASKYVLQTYKSDLDTNLESHDSQEMEIGVGNSEGVNPIRITFGRRKEVED